jgi:mannitol-specific phosphotransferase system IIBC component
VAATSAPLVGAAMIVAGVGGYAIVSLQGNLYARVTSGLARLVNR